MSLCVIAMVAVVIFCCLVTVAMVVGLICNRMTNSLHIINKKKIVLGFASISLPVYNAHTYS